MLLVLKTTISDVIGDRTDVRKRELMNWRHSHRNHREWNTRREGWQSELASPEAAYISYVGSLKQRVTEHKENTQGNNDSNWTKAVSEQIPEAQ